MRNRHDPEAAPAGPAAGSGGRDPEEVHLRPSALFWGALVSWMAGFVLVSRLGTWTPLAVLGPVLACTSLWFRPAARRLATPSWRLLALGLCGAAVMTAGTYAGFAVGVSLFPRLRELTQGLYALLASARFDTGERALLISLVATSEELVFRATALPGLPSTRVLRGPRPLELRAVFINAALVGLAHLASGSLLLAGIAFACGLIWGALRVATGSAIPSIVTHVLWDLAILIMRPLV